jgi:hypothetical protein
MSSVKTIGLYTLFLGVMLISCSEESDPKTFDTSVFSGRTSKTWKLAEMVARKTGRPDVPIYQLRYDPCERDDRYTFYASEKLFEVDNRLFACGGDDSEPILIRYVWSFNSATGSLSMVLPHIFGYYFIPFTVKEISDDEMELEIFLNEEGTESYGLFFEKVSEE